ncbi:MAG: DUF3843 family protein [Bacteroidia bacterium]|nr:DUF3843 family protein [Bacteroidia bacterium]
MKNEKIYMQRWLTEHGRQKIGPTDEWYVNFANKLLEELRQILPNGTFQNQGLYADLAIYCAHYLEDCVANSGEWIEFRKSHQKLFGKTLPFYCLTEAYLDDEINPEDVALILWIIQTSEVEEGMYNPLDRDLMKAAQQIYERLDVAFEEAPIREERAYEWLGIHQVVGKRYDPVPLASLTDQSFPRYVKEFLEATKGEPLAYFDSFGSLRGFLVNSLKWEDNKEALIPELEESNNFVLFANAKGLLIATDVASYFADSRNPTYNQEMAEYEAAELFLEGGLCPFDLIKYAMTNQLLPDAQLPFENGKALLQENWDFIARWFLDEYYEGD